MFLWLIFDIAIIAVFAFSIHRSVKNGMINASKSILSIILTVIIMTSSHAYITAWFKTSDFGDKISESISEMVEKRFSETIPYSQGTEEIGKNSLSFIDKLISQKSQELQEAQKDFTHAITDQITDSVLGLIAVIFLYIAIRLFLFILFKILGLVFELPLLRSVNKVAGAIIGIVNALFIVYILTGAMVLFLPADISMTVQNAVSQTYITKYFYENNILFKLFI